tara:strand:+ start:13412 stop:13891 length:480 start_codon:yes stop_codon:yes gene_type:complete
MKVTMRDSQLCVQHADYAVKQRRRADETKSIDRGNTLLAAMLVESKVVDEILSPMNMTYVDKLEYLSKNSVFIRSNDGHEAIQIVLTPQTAICIHRLLSKEFRNEFKASWLGVWPEPLKEMNSDALVKLMKIKVQHREDQRAYFGVNAEMDFAGTHLDN